MLELLVAVATEETAAAAPAPPHPTSAHRWSETLNLSPPDCRASAGTTMLH